MFLLQHMSLQHYINYILTYSIILELTRSTYICEIQNTGGRGGVIIVCKIKHVLDMFYWKGSFYTQIQYPISGTKNIICTLMTTT